MESASVIVFILTFFFFINTKPKWSGQTPYSIIVNKLYYAQSNTIFPRLLRHFTGRHNQKQQFTCTCGWCISARILNSLISGFSVLKLQVQNTEMSTVKFSPHCSLYAWHLVVVCYLSEDNSAQTPPAFHSTGSGCYHTSVADTHRAAVSGQCCNFFISYFLQKSGVHVNKIKLSEKKKIHFPLSFQNVIKKVT